MIKTKQWLALLGAAVLLVGCSPGGEEADTSSDAIDSTEVVDPENTSDVPKDPIDVKVETLYEEQGAISDVALMEDFAERVELVRVIEGDTIVVKTGQGEETIRLLLVDTPEMKDQLDEQGRPEPYAEEARTYLEAHLDKVTLYLERAESQMDPQEQTLGYIWRTEGDATTNVSSDIIKEGYGRVADVFAPNLRYVDSFYADEEVAMDEAINIWEYPGYASEEGFDRSFITEE